MGYLKDSKGNFLDPQILTRIISQRSNAPVYTLYEFDFGTGIVGGKLLSAKYHGYQSANIVLRVLEGASPDKIPVEQLSNCPLQLDYRQLIRFAIPLSLVPDDAIIINKPHSLYDEYKYQIIGATFIIIILIITVLLLGVNIKSRKKTENDLKIEHDKMENLLNSATLISIIATDLEGKITIFNPGAEKMLGYSADEMINIETPLKFHLESEIIKKREELLKEYGYQTSGFESFIYIAREFGFDEGEWTYVRKDGKLLKVIIKVTSLKDDKGEITGYLGIAIDISKQKELESRLSHKNKMDAVGQLSAGVAHDFNNMLAGIIGAVQVLQYSSNGFTEKEKKLLDIINNASNRASDLTAKLLAFGRKGKMDSTAVDVHHLVRESMEILGRSIDKRISLFFNDDAEDYIVNGDSSSLQNAIMNLAINSSQAMPDGGELSISTNNVILNEELCSQVPFDVKPGDYLSISVRDTGMGIPEEIIGNIFNPFFTTKDEGKGTGLGLAAVYGTVQDHHGIIKVYSEVGKGTVFNIFLPCSHEKIELKRKDKKIIKGTGTILLIDDEDFIRATGQYMLEKMGYEVITAVNGIDGLGKFINNLSKIDLVIMDMIMPEMNGRDAFIKMRGYNPDCKVIIASGFSNDSISEMREEGLAGYIQKPFNDYDLSILIYETLKKF